LLNNADENVVVIFKLLEQIVQGMESVGCNHRPVFKGEIYLTDKELSEKLRISRRTLQEYRSAGKIPYYIICGKIIYKESEIEKMISAGYRKIVADDDLI